MRVAKIKLLNFRNYQRAEFSFSPGTNIIVGKNAQGKTNLLEAIFTCAIGKRKREEKDNEVILFGQENAKIELEVEKKFGKTKIEIYFLKNKKAIKINGLPIRRTGELLGELRCVFFSPDELKLIKESPEDRRRFMDISLSQISKAYFNSLNKYDKIIRSRNKLIKDFKDKNSVKKSNLSTLNLDDFKRMISVYDAQLSDCAAKISLSRNNLVLSIAPYAKRAHEFLTDGAEGLEIEYQTSFPVETSVLNGNEIVEKFKEKYLALYEKTLEKDLALGYTSIGPHRDDIKVLINKIDVKSFCSQGQQRTAALSLKLAELEIINKQTGEMPILILDDVLSELDEARRTKLLKFCSSTQTFISSTDVPEKIKNSRIIRIKSGQEVKN